VVRCAPVLVMEPAGRASRWSMVRIRSQALDPGFGSLTVKWMGPMCAGAGSRITPPGEHPGPRKLNPLRHFHTCTDRAIDQVR
jgi:hypothetical protein